jgi:hypothetical protein
VSSPGDSSDDDDNNNNNGASSSPPASSLSVFLLLPLLGRPAGDQSYQRVRSAAGRQVAAAAALRRNSVDVDSKVFPHSPSAAIAHRLTAPAASKEIKAVAD